MTLQFRANIYFTNDGITQGIAQWCKDQATVRLQMAFHLNEGALNEEPVLNQVKNNGAEWEGRFFVTEENALIIDDFFTQISSLWHFATTTIDGNTSYMDLHFCRNDENKPCHAPHRKKETDPLPTGDVYPVFKPPSGSHDTYPVGAIVWYPNVGDQLYINSYPNNPYAPGVYGWDVYNP